VKIDDKTNLTRVQLPVVASYALTIHKAQGIGLVRMVLDVETPYAGFDVHMKIYTAFSRVTSSDGLAFIGTPTWDFIHHAAPPALLDLDRFLQSLHERTMARTLPPRNQ